MSFALNFEEVLLAFNKNKVDYMLVGGYAVNFYGYNRSTSDLDVWVKPEEENKTKLCAALKFMKFPKEGILQVNGLDFSKPFSFKIGTDPVEIDIFNSMSGVK